MERLPAEINTKILIGFPIKTLSQLKCVSKSFNTFLRSHHFTKLHLDRNPSDNSLKVLLVAANASLHTLNIHGKRPSRPLALHIPSNLFNSTLCYPTRLVGSCMGLVCLHCPPNTYSFLNPTTREFRVLPDPGRYGISRRPPIKLSGFCYVPLLDDFMVVSVGIYKRGKVPPAIKVYSAKTDSWKSVAAGIEVPLCGYASDISVNANGVAYWLGWTSDPRVFKIIGFDFAKEKFSTILLHENINQREIKGFLVLDGCICVLVPHIDRCFEMWVMKECGVVESWTKTFPFRTAISELGGWDFPISGAYIDPLGCAFLNICDAGNKILFEINNQLVLCDPVKGIVKKFKAVLREITEREGRLDMARYGESLVSPYGYICQDKGHIANHIPEENKGVKQEVKSDALKEKNKRRVSTSSWDWTLKGIQDLLTRLNMNPKILYNDNDVQFMAATPSPPEATNSATEAKGKKRKCKEEDGMNKGKKKKSEEEEDINKIIRRL